MRGFRCIKTWRYGWDKNKRDVGVFVRIGAGICYRTWTGGMKKSGNRSEKGKMGKKSKVALGSSWMMGLGRVGSKEGVDFL